MSKHKMKFDGCSPHNGEYWYSCTACGVSDWCASYSKDTFNLDHMGPCKPKAKPKKSTQVECNRCNGTGKHDE